MALEQAVRTPTQPRAIKTRAALLRAAAKEFSKRGYAGTTAKSIATRARVATGSFYQYFTNKDAVLRELAAVRQRDIASRTIATLEGTELGTREIDGAIVKTVGGKFRGIVQTVVEQHREDPAFHAVLTERRHVDQELEVLIGAGERELVERIAALLRRWGVARDPEANAFVIFSMIEGSVHAHVLGEPVVDDERFVNELVRALLRVAIPFELPPVGDSKWH